MRLLTLALGLTLIAAGCSGSDADGEADAAVATGTDAAAAAGLDASTAAGADAATTAGADASTAAGADASTADFWNGVAYDSTCSSSVSAHNAGKSCLGCHGSWLMGGTVYQSGAGVGHVEVGISDGTHFVKTCSGTNGNFWVVSGSMDWANAEIRLRDAQGETVGHPPNTPTGNCNSCHTSSNRITAP